MFLMAGVAVVYPQEEQSHLQASMHFQRPHNSGCWLELWFVMLCLCWLRHVSLPLYRSQLRPDFSFSDHVFLPGCCYFLVPVCLVVGLVHTEWSSPLFALVFSDHLAPGLQRCHRRRQDG